ncbi:hypothetical protein FACS1894181_11230 [Bacteroidia bacterium]|nr:hypothetical protein FACS1894181_11230 [Bacteroidia bacterium]
MGKNIILASAAKQSCEDMIHLECFGLHPRKDGYGLREIPRCAANDISLWEGGREEGEAASFLAHQ